MGPTSRCCRHSLACRCFCSSQGPGSRTRRPACYPCRCSGTAPHQPWLSPGAAQAGDGGHTAREHAAPLGSYEQDASVHCKPQSKCKIMSQATETRSSANYVNAMAVVKGQGICHIQQGKSLPAQTAEDIRLWKRKKKNHTRLFQQPRKKLQFIKIQQSVVLLKATFGACSSIITFYEEKH